MKRNFIKKTICLVLLSITLLGTLTIGVSAEWKQDSTGWWYTEGNSYATGWRSINNKWYYFNNNGYMVTNNYVGNYFLDNNGVWVQNTNINSNNTTNVSNVNNVNSNNTVNNITNNINNGLINNTNITNNNVYIDNSSDKNDYINNIGTDKVFNGTTGFKKVDENKYSYYENGELLKNTWKKFDEGYRYFDKDGYLTFNKSIDGLSIDNKGTFIFNNDIYSSSRQYIFIHLKPYVEIMGKYANGNLKYITDTYNTFGVKYSINYEKVYDKDKDNAIISIETKYNKKISDSSSYDNAEKIITIGKYSSRLSLN